MAIKPLLNGDLEASKVGMLELVRCLEMMSQLIGIVSVNHPTETLVSEVGTNQMTVKEAAKMRQSQEIIVPSPTTESSLKTTTEEL